MPKVINHILFVIFLLGSNSNQAIAVIPLFDQSPEFLMDSSKTEEVYDTMMLVKDIYLGSYFVDQWNGTFNSNGSSPHNFINLNDDLIFTAYSYNPEETNGLKLWKSDGTESGTVSLTDRIKYVLQGVSGNIFFTHIPDRMPHGCLSKTDGTQDGTVSFFCDSIYDFRLMFSKGMYKDRVILQTPILNSLSMYINPWSGHTSPYYAAYDILLSDGTESGTSSIFDSINYEQLTKTIGRRFLSLLELNNTSLIFTYDDIYRTNDSFSEFTPLGLSASSIYRVFKVSESLAFFTAHYGDENDSGTRLWKTDGTAEGTSVISGPLQNVSYRNRMYNFNGVLFFSVMDELHGWELWQSDGTALGTRLVKDIYEGSRGSFPSNFIKFKNKLYFITDDQLSMSGLWVSDGTEKGTKLIKKLPTIYDTYRCRATIYKDDMFLLINTEEGNSELWISDGTRDGTRLMKTLSSNDYYKVDEFIFINDVMYFSRYTDEYGNELWKYVLPHNLITSVESFPVKKFYIYPNPTSDILHIVSEFSTKHIVITNMLGGLVYQNEIEDDFLNVSFLSPGIYIISINNTSARFVKN